MVRIEPRTGALFGFAAVAVWVVLYLVAALSTPGYTITGNRLSDLGNPSRPADWVFNSACILAGLFFLPFASGLGAGMREWMRRVGSYLLSLAAIFLVLLGIFHEESPYNLHFIFSALFFILFMMAISHYAVGMWRNPRYGKVSGILSVIASGLALLFIVAVVVEAVGGVPIAGGVVSNVLEHVTVFAGLAWAGWNGVRLFAMGRSRQD
ncbi:MAG TPA: DUF998 domain-containing protein [Thermoplasmata archaeon]|nr:DUF998 domain-containing protein [Thermoplasmata archaeon]